MHDMSRQAAFSCTTGPSLNHVGEPVDSHRGPNYNKPPVRTGSLTLSAEAQAASQHSSPIGRDPIVPPPEQLKVRFNAKEAREAIDLTLARNLPASLDDPTLKGLFAKLDALTSFVKANLPDGHPDSL
jgi:hypothetical protein